MRITFLGAAREVTGSCHRIDTGSASFLVDCGMFQGADAEHRNFTSLRFDAAAIDFVLLTHAHIDHSGLIPRLVQRGFRGRVYATPATRDLLEVMLADSASIQEKDAERSGGKPLYTVPQARACLHHIHAVPYEQDWTPAPGISVRFHDAGHILGAASIEAAIDLPDGVRRLVFSGDIGQVDRPLVRDPTPVSHADVLVMESTYGNRLHKPLDASIDELCAAVTETLAARRGNVVIPAFSVGRTQELLYLLVKLHQEGRLPDLDIVVDSPLATEATRVTLAHWRLLDPGVGETLEAAMRADSGARIRFTESVEESKALSRVKQGTIIVAGSGMCDGGRVQYHLRDNLPRPDSAVVIIGFQAQGTLGRRLVDGAREVRIHGVEVPVRARLHTIGGLSAHADQAGLMQWLGNFQRAPQQTFVVHGEADTAQAFAALIERDLKWKVQVPGRGDSAEI